MSLKPPVVSHPKISYAVPDAEFFSDKYNQGYEVFTKPAESFTFSPPPPTLDPLVSMFEKMGNAFLTTKQLRLETLKNSSQNVRDWFNKFDIQTLQYTYDQKGFEVVKWFEDTALHFWKMMPSDNCHDYKQIQEYIIGKFSPSDHHFHAKSSFYSMKQELHESIDDFSHRLHSCKDDWPSSEHSTFEADLIKVFKHGVLTEIRKHLVTLKSPDFDTITQYARTIEKLLKSSETDTSVESPIFPSNKPSTRETITCFKCQNTGHIAKECPKKSLEPQRVNNKLFCVICGKNNHLAIKCFQWKNSQKSNAKYQKSPGHQTQRNQYCTNCNKSNHSTFECRRLKNMQKPDHLETSAESNPSTYNLNRN